uniref:Uncharacterized protein n=1 Tax=Encephalitozoon cuniculi TaxID=6035 RepID=M1KB58_ENCCN|nr:hypothetical protein ECU10_1800 [Encephalitozoon cuniculi]
MRKDRVIAFMLTFVVLLILCTGAIVMQRRSRGSQSYRTPYKSGCCTSEVGDKNPSRGVAAKDRTLRFRSLTGTVEENEDVKSNSFVLAPGENHGLTGKEDFSHASNREPIEDKLFRRSPRLISFDVKKGDYIGSCLFELLRKTIDNICDNTPAGQKIHKTFEVNSEHTGLISHYMKYLRVFSRRLEVLYYDNLEVEDIYTPYSDSIDCFTGIKLTKYHTSTNFTEEEQKYISYIRQFVDPEAEKIPIKIESEAQSRLNAMDHIVYTLLHYISLFYSKSQNTMDMLYAKVRAERTGTSTTDPSRVINGYKYSDIVESVRPIHFVNTNACIVKPLIVK